MADADLPADAEPVGADEEEDLAEAEIVEEEPQVLSVCVEVANVPYTELAEKDELRAAVEEAFQKAVQPRLAGGDEACSCSISFHLKACEGGLLFAASTLMADVTQATVLQASLTEDIGMVTEDLLYYLNEIEGLASVKTADLAIANSNVDVRSQEPPPTPPEACLCGHEFPARITGNFFCPRCGRKRPKVVNAEMVNVGLPRFDPSMLTGEKPKKKVEEAPPPKEEHDPKAKRCFCGTIFKGTDMTGPHFCRKCGLPRPKDPPKGSKEEANLPPPTHEDDMLRRRLYTRPDDASKHRKDYFEYLDNQTAIQQLTRMFFRLNEEQGPKPPKLAPLSGKNKGVAPKQPEPDSDEEKADPTEAAMDCMRYALGERSKVREIEDECDLNFKLKKKQGELQAMIASLEAGLQEMKQSRPRKSVRQKLAPLGK
eukprot:TRINITY_DN21131_c0_g1_i1.p1 TRINITY_DN21131_c0_g1~~TRINITY_DN21131_c0_g1_i1.p1  ORF type:complete len:428 (-),score=113.94 TRINITY_DN21131_c0_g1_i1:62-1345(-)